MWERFTFYGLRALLVLFLVVLGSAAAPLLSGRLAPLFWGGLVVVGLLIPLALDVVGRKAKALGALAAVAAYSLAGRAGGRRAAVAAGALVALHPGLLAYTPAMMTEGVTAALVACAACAAENARVLAVGPLLRSFAAARAAASRWT